MAKIAYDVSDVEAGGGGNEPQPAMYPARIVTVTNRKQKSNGDPVNDLEVVLDLGPEYVRKYTYIQLDNPNARWKLREFTDAVGLPPKGAIDPAKLAGKEVVVKIKAGTGQDSEYRGEVKNLFKPGSETVSDGEATALATSAEDDYSSWSKEDLLAELDTRGLEPPTGRVTEQKLIDILVEDDAAAGGDPEPEAEVDGELTAADAGFYGDWTDQDLKDQMSDDGIKLEGRFGRSKAIEALVAHNSGGEATAEVDADGDPIADEYDTFTDDELKEEIADRVKDGADVKVAGRWSRDKAIDALRKDDLENPF